jgi:putative transposase
LAQKKISVAPVEKKKAMVDPDYPMIPISRQCDLLRFARSSFYYDSQRDDSYNLMLLNRIDEQFTKTPFYGVPKMTAWLRAVGYPVNPKRIRRLMRRMPDFRNSGNKRKSRADSPAQMMPTFD